MKTEEALRKKIARIKKSQEEAERLLEEKSTELFSLNQNLEALVEQRTSEAKVERDRAIKANQAKSQFLANMSHEIRTPLNGMLGFLELLQDTSLNSSQKEHLEIIHSSGNLLLSLINDILEFSKIEAGKLDLDCEKFHLKRCIEEIVDVLSNSAFSKGLSLSVYIDEGIPKNLLGDVGRIRQIMVNLIGNAIKFTPSGEVSIGVYLKQAIEGNRATIRFEVTDTGIGIPEDKQAQIFSPFSQADLSDTRKFGGTGLGLTISHQIVEKMGGELTVDSKEGIGSRFYFQVDFERPKGETFEYSSRNLDRERVGLVGFSGNVEKNLFKRLNSWNCEVNKLSISDLSGKLVGPKVIVNIEGSQITSEELVRVSDSKLEIALAVDAGSVSAIEEKMPTDKYCTILRKPIKRESLFDFLSGQMKVDELKIAPKKVKEDTMSVDSQRATVLVAEDNLVNQKVIGAILKKLDLPFEIVDDGKKALDLAKQYKFQIVLMDCQMPIMDGLDATKNIREFDTKIPIIALTANAFKSVKMECFEVGMNEFLTKPFKIGDLKSIFSKYNII